MNIHLYVHNDPSLKHLLEKLMATLDDLVTKVNDIGTVEDSVITLLADISARLKAAGQDQAKLDALASSLDAQKEKLATAVSNNIVPT